MQSIGLIFLEMWGPCQWNLVASKPSLQLSGFFVKCLCSLCQNHPVKKSCLSNVQTGCKAISTLNWLQSSIRSHGYPQDSPKIAMLRWWRKGRGEKPRDRPCWWLGWAAGLMSNFRPNRAFGKSCRCSWNVVYFHTFSLKGQPFSGTWRHSKGWVDQYGYGFLIEESCAEGSYNLLHNADYIIDLMDEIWWNINEIWWTMMKFLEANASETRYRGGWPCSLCQWHTELLLDQPGHAQVL